jgi:two-component system, cell cycle sensor histidine kinase and response regulator CckA
MATKTPGFETAQDFRPDRTAQALLNLRCAVDHCHDAILIADSAGKIEFVNTSFEGLTGYTAQEAKDGGLTLIINGNPDSNHEGHSPAGSGEALLEEVVEKGSYRGTIGTVRKDGRRIEVDLAMTLVRDYRTRMASVVCTARDITDESALQAELRDARRMDAIGTVASGVAHDFNNLLMVISAYAELGLQTLYCDHPLRRNLQEILSASQRAADLTRQLLASGRGQMPGLHSVNLNSVVEDTCRLLPSVIGEDVELCVSLAKDVGCIKADSGEMERLLLNLALNARDAMPSGGRFSITTQHLASEQNGVPDRGDTAGVQYILLEVADTGEGIPADEIAKIFRPFYTTKTESNGNGLGLAMVERTVRQSGGFITVESKRGSGTVFRMFFPTVGRLAVNPADSKPSENSILHGSETVLVVEDDDAVRECTVELLSSIGYEVLPAVNGEEALALAARHRGKIALMVSDVVMPRMSGVKLAAALAKSQPSMKVLFVSGHPENLVRRKGVEIASQFLQKPYPFRLLATKLRETIEPAPHRHAAAAAGAG